MNDNKRYKTGIFRPSITKIRFNQSATGSRVGPPHKSLTDERFMDRLLELRSTNLLRLHQYYSYTKLFPRQLTPINQPAVSCFEDDGRIIVNLKCVLPPIYMLLDL